MRRAASTFTVFTLALACAAALAGCTSPLAGYYPFSRTVSLDAATVNGTPVSEDEVTDYIEGFRAENTDYETDDGWARFLSQAGYTAEGLRRYVLDTVFIPKLLVKQECTARGISVTDKDLDSTIKAEKAYYEKRYGKDSWDSVLASYGYDKDSWRDNEADRLLEEKLEDAVVEVAEVTDDQVQVVANEKAASYSGRHSWYLGFSTKEQAQAAYERIDEARRAAAEQEARAAAEEAGEAFDEARVPQVSDLTTLAAFNLLASDGAQARDAGWTSLKTDRSKMSNAYTKALKGLAAGTVTAPFEDKGVWKLALCDELFEVAKDEEYIPLERIPEPIVGQLRRDTLEQVRKSEFSSWLSDVSAQASIVVNEMPQGLSYDVDAPLLEPKDLDGEAGPAADGAGGELSSSQGEG